VVHGILALAFILSTTLEASEPPPSAPRILEEYLALPLPDSDPLGEARGARLDILRRLWPIPEEAVSAISVTLPTAPTHVHRIELLEVLGRLPTPQSADLLAAYLEVPDSKLRGAALHGLRRLASRIERRGVVDVPLEPEFAPKVDGLLPHLIAAANDEDPEIRASALFALADTRSPQAVKEIRHHLRDLDDTVRLRAACLLTEFDDDSGLDELGLALAKLTNPDAEEVSLRYFMAEHVLASLARITEDNPGPPPMQPALASNTGRAEELRKEYEDLLDRWALWWAEQ
jgi:HEAT repeat protein